MKEVTLDGKKILTESSFHEEMKNKLDLPDYYGENLDALWDCITGEIELPIRLIWQDSNASKSGLDIDFYSIK